MTLPREARVLRNFYFGAFFIGVFIVVLLHTIEPPAIDILRLPNFIGLASLENGLEYFTTMKIYQVSITISLAAILIDAVCLTDWRSKALLKASEISTVVGLTVLLIAIFFFSYNFLILGKVCVEQLLSLLPYQPF